MSRCKENNCAFVQWKNFDADTMWEKTTKSIKLTSASTAKLLCT